MHYTESLNIHCDGLVTCTAYPVEKSCLLCYLLQHHLFSSFLMLIILVDSYLGRAHELDVPLS